MAAFNRLKRWANPFFFLLGLALLYTLIHRFGVHELVKTFELLGYRLVYILILPLVWYLFQAAAWFLILEETGTHVSFWRLFTIKLMGESVNTLTPISFIGGDPVRIYMLQKDMPGTLSTASVVLDRTIQSLAVVLLVLLGLLFAWFELELPPAWEIAFPVLTAVMFAMVAFFIHRQKKGIFEFVSAGLSKMGFKRHLTGSLPEKIAVLDERISRFYRHDPKRFALTVGLHFMARLVGVVEIYLIASFLQTPLTWAGALFLASLSVLVNMVFVFIPGSMGVLEGAYGALFHLMGLNPVSGVAVQLIRRVRTLFWVAIGLIPMAAKPRGRDAKELAVFHEKEA